MKTVELEMYITWIQNNPELYQELFNRFMKDNSKASKISSELRNESKIVIIAQFN